MNEFKKNTATNPLSMKTLSTYLHAWNSMYPYPKTEGDLAKVASRMFLSFQKYFSDETFKIAAGMIEDTCKAFPVIPDLLAVQEAAQNEYRRRNPQLRITTVDDNAPTPEEWEAYKAINHRVWNHEITLDQALAEVDKLIKHGVS